MVRSHAIVTPGTFLRWLRACSEKMTINATLRNAILENSNPST